MQRWLSIPPLGAAVLASLCAPHAHATENEWHVVPLAEVSYANSDHSRTMAYGGSVGLRHDVRHWLTWEVVDVGWHYGADVSPPPGPDGGYRYSLHRVQALSTALLRPPLAWQIKMHHVVPSIGAGLGVRTDVRANRQELSANGSLRQPLEAETRVAIVQHITVGLDVRFADHFSFVAHARFVGERPYSLRQWDVNAGFLFAVSFYGD